MFYLRIVLPIFTYYAEVVHGTKKIALHEIVQWFSSISIQRAPTKAFIRIKIGTIFHFEQNKKIVSVVPMVSSSSDDTVK